MSGRVTDEAVRVAEEARVCTLNALVSYGSAGVEERHSKAMRAALEAAAPHMRGGEEAAEPRQDVPEGLVVRIESAIQRIHEGHACMRIPADPNDPDLVLADVLSWITPNAPPKADRVSKETEAVDLDAVAEMLDLYASLIDGEKKLGVDDCHYPPIIRELARKIRIIDSSRSKP